MTRSLARLLFIPVLTMPLSGSIGTIFGAATDIVASTASIATNVVVGTVDVTTDVIGMAIPGLDDDDE